MVQASSSAYVVPEGRSAPWRCVGGVYQLTPAQQDLLNSCRSIEEIERRFPFLRTARLHPGLEIIAREETDGQCAQAAVLIHPGEIISKACGSWISRPFRYSRQIGPAVHVVGRGAIDHSCVSPTAVVDQQTQNLIASRAIQPGELITFNYLTTEAVMANPFDCCCSYDEHRGPINGFDYLTAKQQHDLAARFPLAWHLQERLKY